MAKENKGKPQVHYTEEEILEVSQKVCDLYASDEYTIASCCEACGVSDRLFRYWVVKYPEVSEMYKKAKDMQDKIFFEMLIPSAAKKSLIRLIEGEEYTQEKKETDEKGKVIKTTKTDMRVLPNVTAVIFAAKGAWPDTYTDRQKVEHTGGIATINPDKLSAEEKRALLALTEKAS